MRTRIDACRPVAPSESAQRATTSQRTQDPAAVSIRWKHCPAGSAPPSAIHVDNGTEFTSKVFDHWAYANKVRLDFSRPGKPTDNAFIESFNVQVRRECLSQHYFSSLIDARVVLDAWREEYNNRRPHGSLGQPTPAEYRAEVEGAEVPEQLALSVPGCSSVG